MTALTMHAFVVALLSYPDVTLGEATSGNVNSGAPVFTSTTAGIFPDMLDQHHLATKAMRPEGMLRANPGWRVL